MENIIEEGKVVQQESLKLTKNSKGYTWEIKILAKDKELSDADLTKLQELNNKMLMNYGGVSNEDFN